MCTLGNIAAKWPAGWIVQNRALALCVFRNEQNYDVAVWLAPDFSVGVEFLHVAQFIFSQAENGDFN